MRRALNRGGVKLDYNELFEPQSEDALRVTVPAVSISERVHQEHHILFWQVRGGSHFTIDGEAIRLFAGQALWVPVGTSHEFSVGDKSVLLPLFFEAEDDSYPLLELTVIRVSRRLQSLMLPYMQWQSSILRPTDDGGAEILQLLEHASAIAKNPPLVEPGESSDDGVSIPSEACITFGQWRMRNRIETAALLLQRSGRLKEVASSVGYLDVGSFGRSFKNHFGVSLEEYAEHYAAQRGA